MNRTLKVVGKLSLWGIFLGFLLWLGKQLLMYLLALIKPWITWLLGWLMLILGVVGLLVVGVSIGVAYVAYRSWKHRKNDRKQDKEDKKDKEDK
jgi:hypothetical protein